MRHKKRRWYVAQGAKLLPPWMNAQNIFGKAENRRQSPKRYILLVREGLKGARLRYWEHVTVWNHLYRPALKYDAGYQTIDFIVKSKDWRHFAVLVYNPVSVVSESEKHSWESKQAILKERKIPLLILPKHLTSQEYMITLLNFIRKGKNQ